MLVVAYPRETQEMVFDAHNRAFAFFGGVPQRMVYDNLKAVVEAIFTGKERQFNRRFMVLANHYLFEPVACTPASGWGEPSCAIGPSGEGERAGRKSSRQHPRMAVHAAGAVCEL